MSDEDNEIHATIRADVGQFQQMIDETSLDGETEHSDIYLNILEDEVQILQMAPGEVVLTFGTYREDFFDEITLERDLREMEGTDRAGNEFAYRVGAEAILDVDQTSTYLGFASDGGTVELKLTGSTEQRLASFARANGALEAWVKLPGSQSVLEDVPHWLPLRFSNNEVYTNQAGDEAPTQISTKVSKLDTIIDAVEEDKDAEYFPVVVKDDDFWIDIGDESRSGVSGALHAQNVEGPNVENYYFDGFKEIVSVLNGAVELQTAPGGNPLSIVQENSSRVIRHVNGTVNA